MITQPYTLAEIKQKIASGDYNAELLLQHAMLLLEASEVDRGPTTRERDLVEALKAIIDADDRQELDSSHIEAGRAVVVKARRSIRITAADSARQPLTREQREAVVDRASIAMDADPNLSWRNAIINEVERAYGIGAKGGAA